MRAGSASLRLARWSVGLGLLGLPVAVVMGAGNRPLGPAAVALGAVGVMAFALGWLSLRAPGSGVPFTRPWVIPVDEWGNAYRIRTAKDLGRVGVFLGLLNLSGMVVLLFIIAEV